MRVAIVGAGNVGRSIARELLANGHQVLLIDRDPAALKTESVPSADWLLADACELDALEDAGFDTVDVSIAATGDDKANLVHSLLARTEFGVPRTVGRVNHPGNEWMFNDKWGVDVAVSTPRIMSALVEEAVSVGELVRLLTFRDSANLVELTLANDSQMIGTTVGDLQLPGDGVLVALLRDGRAEAPRPDRELAAGDELLLLISPDHERELAAQLMQPVTPLDQASDDGRWITEGAND